MKRFREFKSYNTEAAFDAATGNFLNQTAAHPFLAYANGMGQARMSLLSAVVVPFPRRSKRKLAKSLTADIAPPNEFERQTLVKV